MFSIAQSRQTERDIYDMDDARRRDSEGNSVVQGSVTSGYTPDWGDFEMDEVYYRIGFEAAQRAALRGKNYTTALNSSRSTIWSRFATIRPLGVARSMVTRIVRLNHHSIPKLD